jgi:ABC-type cobalamin transport system permease subunit
MDSVDLMLALGEQTRQTIGADLALWRAVTVQALALVAGISNYFDNVTFKS